MERQYKTFNQHLNILEKESYDIKIKMSDIENTNDFIMSSIIANNVLANLRNIQDTLLDTITNLQHFNVHLLSPIQMENELSIISSQITKDLSLPLDNLRNNLSNLYRILKVKARMTKQYFIFEIQIPLTSRDDYEIYNAIPLYHQIANSSRTMVNLLPISDHIAINLKKDTFIPVTENDFKNCIEYNDNILSNYLCQIQTPVYERQTDENLCIKSKQTNSCEITTSACQTTWKKLTKLNTYLINCCGQCTFRFICRDRVTVEQVTGTNIIILGTDCIIRGNTLVITPHKLLTNELNIEPVIFAPEIAPVNSIINISIPIHTMNISDGFGQDIDNIENNIKQLKSASDSLENESNSLSYHDVHHYVAIYCLAAAGLAVAGGAWVRATCRRARAARPPPSSGQQDTTVHCVCSKNFKCISVSEKAEQSDYSVSVLGQDIPNQTNRSVHKNTSPVLLKCNFRRTR
ncbi:uncharacterized protein LOC123663936 [Melitaea cinxia]|uniref:uncharacterized protein LOC123663936 n=1 Tax=Melitaea cinxia TaxID=113334 RepID=UPI001E270222|nr:uncharacterized protein LOC123663936 [Melitaea cinxia]